MLAYHHATIILQLSQLSMRLATLLESCQGSGCVWTVPVMLHSLLPKNRVCATLRRWIKCFNSPGWTRHHYDTLLRKTSTDRSSHISHHSHFPSGINAFMLLVRKLEVAAIFRAGAAPNLKKVIKNHILLSYWVELCVNLNWLFFEINLYFTKQIIVS